MAILRYENLTHSELAALPRDKSVVILPTGPLEQHGPHLPLGTDPMTAAFFGEKMAERLSQSRPDWNFILFPALFAGADTLTYTGTIEVAPKNIRALLLDCCKQFTKDGFRTIMALSTHGGPRHNIVLEEVAARVRWRYKARMIVPSGKIIQDILEGGFVDKLAARMEKSGSPLNDAEREGLKHDYHGGLLETSIVMIARPDLVKNLYKDLKPAIVKSFYKLRRTSGRTVGDGMGHLGTPALARPEIGQAAVDVLLDDVTPLLERFLNGENVNREFRTKFYFIPFLRTDFRILVIFAVACFVMTAVIWFMNTYLMEMFS